MRIKARYDQVQETILVTATGNCHTDAVPLVSELTIANARFDLKCSAFHLGCAILLRDYCGEVIEFEGAVVGPDFGEAIRMALRAPATVNAVDGLERSLTLGQVDVACFPARHRDIDWPIDAEVPLVVANWSGDFVPPGGRRATEQVIGRYFTNAGLIADETTVSIALGLMAGGNRLRRLLVPVPRGTSTKAYDALVGSLAVAGIELVLVRRSADAKVPKQAVVMLSHTADRRVVEHFQRLRHETEGLMPAFLALHNPKGIAAKKADIVVNEAGIAALMPTRYRELGRVKGRYDKGFVDLVTQAIAYDPLLKDFEHLWFIEYDVDFSGNWADFFKPTMDNDADLLTSRLLTEDQLPHWINWADFRYPADLPYNQRLASFMPASRQSRAFFEAYREEMEGGRWQGHSESTVPSVALYRGLKIEDMLVPGRFAHRGPSPFDNLTYGYRPARSDAYFHEVPNAFAQPGRLYHPVKAVAQVDGLTVTRETLTRSPVEKKLPRTTPKRRRKVEA
jgi:hypothetical protein